MTRDPTKCERLLNFAGVAVVTMIYTGIGTQSHNYASVVFISAV